MSTKKIDVLAIGELNVDLILNDIEGFPVIGKEIMAGSMTLTLGSSTAIFAANLSSLGAKVGFLGKIGKDSFGDLVKNSLAEKGVDTSYLVTEEKIPTGATIALSYAEDRAMVTFPGAMNHLTLDDISDEALASARHIHFSSCFIQPGMADNIDVLFKRAKDLGLTTSLDTQWDPSEKWDFDYKNILPYVDIFLPNETEILHITKTKNLEEAIQKIAPFVRNIVIKKGSKGAVIITERGEHIEKPAYLNKNVIDSIGAGDSFNAGFVFKYVKGEPLDKCLDFGNLTGALNTTASGGTGAFQSKKSIQDTLKSRFNVTVNL